MPVYEYVCKACGEHVEVSQSFKDDPLTTCPVCEGPLRKVFGSIGIVLKGSGFYRTDSRIPAKRPGGDKSEKAGSEKAGAAEKASSEKAGAGEKSSSDGAAAKSGSSGSGESSGSGGSGGGSSKPSSQAAKTA